MHIESPYIIVQVSAGNRDEAATIARTVVERKLVACAQIVPIHSFYEWKGTIESEDEFLILMKTRRDVYSDLEACILDIHSYDVPEIMALPVVAGLESYTQWIDSVVVPR